MEPAAAGAGAAAAPSLLAIFADQCFGGQGYQHGLSDQFAAITSCAASCDAPVDYGQH